MIIGEARSKKQARRTPSVPRPKLPIARERLENTMSELGIDMDNKEDVRKKKSFILQIENVGIVLVSLCC